MNVAFVEYRSGAVIRTRAALTPLGRPEFEATLGEDETLESFLYASPPGPTWPCGPTAESWRHLCEAAAADPTLREGLEAALAGSRHRFLAC